MASETQDCSTLNNSVYVCDISAVKMKSVKRGALGPTENCKTVGKIVQNRKTENKFDQNRKLHAKLSKPIHFHIPLIKTLIDPIQW